MKENNIYIPSAEEIERALKNNEVKVHRLRSMLEDAGEMLKAYKKNVNAEQSKR